MKVKLWGVRGSLPAAPDQSSVLNKIKKALNSFVDFQKQNPEVSVQDFLSSSESHLRCYGGHTSCLEIFSDQIQLIVDGGSGIRPLAEHMMLGAAGLGRAEIHILMTHFHWDHLIGLPFFTPLFIPGNKIHFYAVQEDLEENIRRMFTKPNFPVPFEALGSEIFFHRLEPRRSKKFADIEVTPYQLDHPDPCWGYRFERLGRAYAHCVDTEGVRVSPDDLGEDVKLYRGVQAMTFDAQYSFEEAAEKINWGHSSAPIGLDIAMRERIPKVFFMHHDPSADDEQIQKLEAKTREYYDKRQLALSQSGQQPFEVEWCFARDGIVFDV